MKTILLILVVAGAGFLGYIAEPSLRSKLTGSLTNHPKATAVPQTEAVPEVPVQLEPEPSPAPAPIPPQDVAPAAEAAPEAMPAESVPETPAQVGWALSSFAPSRGEGVGDCRKSWGFNGAQTSRKFW
jgi:hypothetical protein